MKVNRESGISGDIRAERVRIRGEDVSICVLTYNHAHAIEETLNSLLQQTLPGYEVIVSDDCSTDGTWEKIVEISQRDSRIRPVRTPRNLHMAGNANFAVAQTQRPYIALLHHDDIYRDDLLEKWMGVMARHPDVGFVFNAYDHGKPEQDRAEFSEERMDGDWFLRSIMLRRWGCPVRGTAMIRRSCWDLLGGMRTEFDLLADIDLWMRLSRVAAVGYVPEKVIKVRVVRPDDYPDIYTGKTWRWKRRILLYEIHAANQLSVLDRKTMSGKLRWFWFRCRLNAETAKWLAYAVVRKRQDIIRTSGESETSYDFGILRYVRRLLQKRAAKNV